MNKKINVCEVEQKLYNSRVIFLAYKTTKMKIKSLYLLSAWSVTKPLNLLNFIELKKDLNFSVKEQRFFYENLTLFSWSLI